LNLEPGVLVFKQHIALSLDRMYFCLSEHTNIFRVSWPPGHMFSKVYTACCTEPCFQIPSNSVQ